jgi:hypothetical protein
MIPLCTTFLHLWPSGTATWGSAFSGRQLWFAHKIHSVYSKHPQATHKITEKPNLNEWLFLSFPSLTSFYLLTVGVESYCWAWSHSTTHTHTLGWTPLDEWSAQRRDLYLTTHNIQNRQSSDAPGRIRTWNPSKETATDPRLTPCSHWDRLSDCYDLQITVILISLDVVCHFLCATSD